MVKAMVDANPQLKTMLSNPETLKQIMSTVLD
jgi:hypothetical protein